MLLETVRRKMVSTIRVSGWDKEATEMLLNPFAYANGTDSFPSR